MCVESGRPGDKGHDNPLDELDDARLRRAVEGVRGSAAPDEALRRAVDRAGKLAGVAAAVRRRPTPLKPARRRLAKAAAAVGILWMAAAIALSIGEYADEAREAARQNLAKNDLRQIGLALHSYFEGERYGKQPVLDATVDASRSMQDADSNGLFSSDHYREILDGLSNTWMADRGLRIRNLTDGTSNTMALGEAVGGDRWTLFARDAGRKKIVHTADVSLVVKQLAAAETELNGLVQKHKGEVANFQVSQAEGKQRAAHWIVRVPPDALDAFLKDVASIGVAERRAATGRDVTEEYVDLETQIENKKALEQRILDLLAKQSGDIRDVLAVENELARIRGEIEQMEGRKKYLDGVTAAATVGIAVREQAEYVPPEVDTFSGQIGRSWTGSLDVVRRFGRSLVLVAVATGPWIPIVAAVGFVIVRLFRRRRSRAGSQVS